MNCYSCGHDVPEGSRFCLECAAPVTDPASRTLTTAGAPNQGEFLPSAFEAAPPAEDPLLVQLRHELRNEYVVEKEVGRGGMAVVFRARETNLNRVVALKVLPPEIAMAGGTADRFKREARMSAGLDHPNIIPVYRVGQAGQLHYMAVKFMEGRALDSIVEAQGALPLPVVILVLKAAASALAYAHDKGVVHRDIKGANILVDKDGRVVVADFGIARAQEEASLTASGMIVGTPYFMSPEQCSGSKVGGQSDQYSLGILAFQLLTGEVPFQADSLMGILQHHFMTPPPDIRGVRSGVPEQLLAVVERSLAKRAEDRYASTRDMVSALKAVPFSDAEEHEAEAMLKELAQGATTVEKVRTFSLPPLTQQQLGSPAASATGYAPRPGVTSPTPAGLGAQTPATVGVQAPDVDALGRPRRPRPVVKKSRVPLIGSLVAGAGLAAFGVMWIATKGETPAPPAASAPADSVPAAPVQAALTTGTLRFDALPPGATVTIDEQPGSAENRELAPGLHRFVVRAEGYQPWSSTADVRAGEIAVLTANMARVVAAAPAEPRQSAPRQAPPAAAPAGPPGKVRISAIPLEADAIIQVDGRQIGKGRVIDFSVPSGRRRLRIAAPGYVTHEETIDVRENETTTKSVRLTPQGG